METRRASYITVCSHAECVVEGVGVAIPGQMKKKESGPCTRNLYLDMKQS